MACGSCRKPRPMRKPSIINPTPSNTVASTSGNGGSNTVGSGDQRSRITGLTYVPKK